MMLYFITDGFNLTDQALTPHGSTVCSLEVDSLWLHQYPKKKYMYIHTAIIYAQISNFVGIVVQDWQT